MGIIVIPLAGYAGYFGAPVGYTGYIGYVGYIGYGAGTELVRSWYVDFIEPAERWKTASPPVG